MLMLSASFCSGYAVSLLSRFVRCFGLVAYGTCFSLLFKSLEFAIICLWVLVHMKNLGCCESLDK
jgi:hypothetical protein